MYIYKYPSCQSRKRRHTVLFAPIRHYPIAAPVWELTLDPLSSHPVVHCPLIQMGPLHCTAAQSRADNSAMSSKHCQELNPFFTVAQKAKHLTNTPGLNVVL